MINLTKYIFSVLVFCAVISCEKGNSYYEGYENTIKTYNGNTYEYLENNRGVFDSLLLVLDRVFYLQDSLKEQDVTLFAPTNQSFRLALINLNTQRRLVNRPPVYLEDIEINELDTLMSKYVFANRITIDNIKDLKDGSYMTSVANDYRMHVKYRVLNASGFVGGGQQQIEFTDPNNSIFERYWNRTTTNSVNIFTSNGVIHILSPAHDFGFGKLGTLSN